MFYFLKFIILDKPQGVLKIFRVKILHMPYKRGSYFNHLRFLIRWGTPGTKCLLLLLFFKQIIHRSKLKTYQSENLPCSIQERTIYWAIYILNKQATQEFSRSQELFPGFKKSNFYKIIKIKFRLKFKLNNKNNGRILIQVLW